MAKKTKKENGVPEPQQQETVQPTAPVAPSPSIWSVIRSKHTARALQLVVLSAIYSTVSQLALSPVYGAVPAGLYHKFGSMAAAMLPYLLRGHTQRYIPSRIAEYLPTLAFWIPSIQFVLFKFSSTFSNPYGPVVTELLTYYPLVVISLYVAGTYLDKLDLTGLDPTVAEICPPFGTFALFLVMQRSLKSFFTRNMGSNVIMSRMGLQLIIASMYTALIPSTFFRASIPSLAFTMLGNVHLPLQRTTGVLNNTLALNDYVLLERQESIAGYLSVLENTKENFRVMRCDHSLLGGEWAAPPGHGTAVKEPIYGVFTMLEAVRLVERQDVRFRPDSETKALALGLGIGTAPAALMTHGVDVSIIELDLMVHKFATNYFGLPKNHTLYIGDAARVAEALTLEKPAKLYDFVIHDLFSGGGISAGLLSLEFLADLATLLKPDGVIAINYAGDLRSPSASLVYRTIHSVFPACRIFRESETPTEVGPDLSNVVFFCRKLTGPFKFRVPVEADFLGSGARQEFLSLKHEMTAADFEIKGRILKRGSTRELDKLQAQSAIEHWRVMRTVLPDVVWENW